MAILYYAKVTNPNNVALFPLKDTSRHVVPDFGYDGVNPASNNIVKPLVTISS